MNQPAQPRTDAQSQRDATRNAMPMTAAFVDRKRGEWGARHVNDCIRQANEGKPGFFYAIEGGRVLGTPFPAGHAIADWQARAVLWGASFAAFMATPEDQRGAN